MKGSSAMARGLSLTKWVLVLAMVVVGMIQSVDAMNLVITNTMGIGVAYTCEKAGVRPGKSGLLNPNEKFTMPIGDGSQTDFTGLTYQCIFTATGKPRTVVTMFEGTDGSANTPCNCVGATCEWTITDAAFRCPLISIP